MVIDGTTWEHRYKTITVPNDYNDTFDWYVGYGANNSIGYRYYAGLRLEKGVYPTNGDYLAPQAALSTTSFKPDNYIFLPPNATEGRIYISALADAIQENDESVKIKLQADKQTDSKGFSYQQYNIGRNNSATLTIKDSALFNAELIITPAGRTGLATIRSFINNKGKQKAKFDLHLASQPQSDVSVQLSINSESSGKLSTSSINFTSSNWDQPQTIKITGHAASLITTITASATSSDPFYNLLSTSQTIVPSSWSDDLLLSLWEGGSNNPSLPVASVQAIDDGEDYYSRFGFSFHLNSPLQQDITLHYTLTPGSGLNLTGPQADIQNQPTPTSDNTYTI